jgi:death-on-curing protein
LVPGIFSKAAVLVDSLIRNHPLLDGNERTGITSARLFLLRNGYQLEAAVEEMISWLKDHSAQASSCWDARAG